MKKFLKKLKELMMKWRSDLDVPYALKANPSYDPTTIPHNPKMGDRSKINWTKSIRKKNLKIL